MIWCTAKNINLSNNSFQPYRFITIQYRLNSIFFPCKPLNYLKRELSWIVHRLKVCLKTHNTNWTSDSYKTFFLNFKEMHKSIVYEFCNLSTFQTIFQMNLRCRGWQMTRVSVLFCLSSLSHTGGYFSTFVPL